MKPVKLCIDQEVQDYPEVTHVKKCLNIPFSIVADQNQVFMELNRLSPQFANIKAGKKLLYLTANKGPFVRQCPGTKHYSCCGYRILHIGTYCIMDCTYCILQTYFHPPVLQYFVNHAELELELADLFAQNKTFRIGTGEFTDSLIYELWTDLAGFLIPLFARQNSGILELKTKTTYISKLKHLEHNRKTIMAWSLNTPAVVLGEEAGAASLQSRLKAAAECQSHGYPLAFHFDPVIIYDGCEEDYRAVIDMLAQQVSPDNIVWISLGTFRWMPSLKPVIQKRFPASKIIYGEFITGLDGKMRYFKPLRIAFYRRIIQWLQTKLPGVLIYFCMEDEEVWAQTMGFIPAERGGLSSMLDQAAVKHCGLL